MGAIQAFETTLPRTEIKGCLFHYGQAINRCVQRIGLQAQYRDAEPGDQLKKWVRRAASLPLSPVDRLDHVWNETINNAPNIPQAAEFHDYVNRTWMAPDARYSPDIWNIYDRLDDSRTINALEGWHHKLNLYIGKAHPNLFELIRSLKKEELFQRSELGRLGAGGPMYALTRECSD